MGAANPLWTWDSSTLARWCRLFWLGLNGNRLFETADLHVSTSTHLILTIGTVVQGKVESGQLSLSAQFRSNFKSQLSNQNVWILCIKHSTP